MEKQKRIPKRRFREFLEAGEWEEKEFRELGSVAMCRRIFKEQTSERGEVPFYKIGTFGTQPDAFISRDLFEKCKREYSYPNVGDILISASGSIGRTVTYRGEDAYFQDSNIIWLQHDSRLDNSFLKQVYEFVEWSGLEGSTIQRLYNKNLLDTKIVIPDNNEQQKIGDFCRRLDTLIALHQQKLSKLKDLKQAYLTEMFPAPGEKRPRRRFKGFSGNWTEKILCHLAEIKDSARVPNNLWTSEGVPYLRSSDLANKGLTGDLYISHHSYEMYKAQTGAPSMGDVLFTSGGQVGITFLKEDDSPLYVQGGAVLYVKTSSSKNLCGQYLKTFFETNIMQSYMANASVGGTIKHFTVGPASNALITYPSVEEQQLIGDFFKRIDNGLYSCQDKLNKLQSLKQAYLSELFV